MGKIKNSEYYIVIILIVNYFCGTGIVVKNSTSITDFIINFIILITISIFEILLTNILINLNNNAILQTKILEKLFAEQSTEKQVDIKQ